MLDLYTIARGMGYKNNPLIVDYLKKAVASGELDFNEATRQYTLGTVIGVFIAGQELPLAPAGQLDSLPGLPGDPLPSPWRFKVGDLISINWQGSGRWFPGLYQGESDQADKVKIQYVGNDKKIYNISKKQIKKRHKFTPPLPGPSHAKSGPVFLIRR